MSNRLVLLNKPDDTPTFYSRVWHSTSSPDLTIATDDIQKISHREVSAVFIDLSLSLSRKLSLEKANLSERFDEEKAEQTRKSWHEKKASLNLEKDTTKLWHLTNLLNDDNHQQKKTVLLVDGKPVTGKAAANVFAKAYEAESRVNLPQDRVRDVRQETKTHTNHREEMSPYMTDSLTMQELQAALKKLKKKKSAGTDGITNEMLKHLATKQSTLCCTSSTSAGSLVNSRPNRKKLTSCPSSRRVKKRANQRATDPSIYSAALENSWKGWSTRG